MGLCRPRSPTISDDRRPQIPQSVKRNFAESGLLSVDNLII